MKVKNKILSFLVATIPLISFANDSDNPIPQIEPSTLRGSFTPYLWLPSMSMNSYYNTKDLGTVNVSQGTILNNLSTGFMGEAELHYDRFGLYANVVYSDLTNNSSKALTLPNGYPANLNTHTNASLGIYTFGGTYTAYNSKSTYLDVLAGARIFNMNTSLSATASVEGIQVASANPSINKTGGAGILGLKGMQRLGESNWFIPFYADVGVGNSTTPFTTQEILGVGYGKDWWAVNLVWNNYYSKIGFGEGQNGYINMTGPALGLSFRF